jgi:hypothetical protein
VSLSAVCGEGGPITASALGDAAQCGAAFERLRARILGETNQASVSRACAPGLGLVLQEGIPGWLKACAQAHLATSTPARPDEMPQLPEEGRPSSTAVGLSSELLPVVQQADLTLLLANLVASTHRARHMAASIPLSVLPPGVT